MTAVAGAIGSIIGYLGAEVGEDDTFERLLWAARYYNYTTPFILFQMGLLMPMGGPLHRAALATLDKFRTNGLYAGARRGNMLGSAFMHDSHASYCTGSSVQSKDSVKNHARNGFWVEVLRHVKVIEVAAGDVEAAVTAEKAQRAAQRAAQKVSHLVLKPLEAAAVLRPGCVLVCETVVSWQSVAGIVMSEITAFIVALVTGIRLGNVWLAVFFCVPAVLKLASVPCSVRREPLIRVPALERSRSRDAYSKLSSQAEKSIELDTEQESAQQGVEHVSEMYELDDRNYGFAVIESPPAIMLQFFRHYGHPIRTLKMDRVREVMGICLCYAFVLYFPAGLLALLWMDPEVQYIWLGYQVFTIAAMHLVRLFGWGNCGRTEKRIADLLTQGKEVWLCDDKGPNIAVTIKIDEATGILAAREMVGVLLDKHRTRRQAAIKDERV